MFLSKTADVFESLHIGADGGLDAAALGLQISATSLRLASISPSM